MTTTHPGTGLRHRLMTMVLIVASIAGVLALASGPASARPGPKDPVPPPSTVPPKDEGFTPTPGKPSRPGVEPGTCPVDDVHARHDEYLMHAGSGELRISVADGVLANDTHDRGLRLHIAYVADPGPGGDIRVADDGAFVFTPDPGFTGVVEFTYGITDWADPCRNDDAASIRITVIDVRYTGPKLPRPWTPALPVPPFPFA